MKWTMWAYDDKDGTGEQLFLSACEDKEWVRMHGISCPIVQVVVTESKTGKYKGWIDKGKSVPEMIWPTHAFEACFAYGSKVEVEAGKGKVIQLEIQKI